MTAIRVLLADDHPLVRVGIRSMLQADPQIEVVGEATDGEQARAMCLALQPHVLLLDLNMPGPPALESIAFVHEQAPTVRILILTAHKDDAHVQSLLTSGVAGYVLKDEVTEQVVNAIHTVAQGGTWFSQVITEKIVEWGRTGTGLPSGVLTAREREILSMVTEGKTNQEIAYALNISEKTVEKHLSEVFSKLDVRSRVKAAVYAVRAGIV
ncbi:MAG: response regulator transcription factor [Chloroflexaceae bacterium]|nr:response regulator transcription factor [Chloroflexaceae bacterium]